jgi:hypothetical protein
MDTQATHPGRPVVLALAGLFLLALPGTATALQIHRQIQGPFADARAVTVKCLECHQQQAEEVLRSSHWTWVRPRTLNGKEVSAGKKDSLAGFAIDVVANGSRCLRCHISTSPDKESFARPAAEMVDCLACHDTTGQYRHGAAPGLDRPADLTALARNVGRPTPRNCTGCHFADCGLAPAAPQGENGQGAADLADVHLRAAAFTCQTCHLGGSGHTLVRQLSGSAGKADRAAGCSSCHTAAPHALEVLNHHGTTIACQACHIPTYGRSGPVLISWNWLMTGKTNTVFRAGNGAGLQLHDQNGFWAARDIEPVYFRDDGADNVYSRGQKIQPQELTVLQQPAAASAGAKLSPFRVLYGTQLYDSRYRYLISPLLQAEGDVLFPGSDWEAIARKGMEAMVLPFSGQYGFAATATYRRLNHGVAPAAEALDCLDCHGATGRIKWDVLGFERDPMLEPEAEPPASTPQVAPQQELQAQPEPVRQQPETLPVLPPVPEPVVPAGPLR